MPTSVLYGLTVLIWGSSWFAITLQTGVVSVELAIAYRFVLAAVILIAYCLATGRRLRYGLRDHLFMAAQGFALFSFNYMLFYRASLDMPSGLMSVCFSTILLMNIANGHLFFRTRVEPRVFVGALFGLAGLTLVFWPEVVGFGGKAVTGLVLSLVATYSASLGNMITVRHKRREIPVIESNAIGMAYGALSSLAIAAALGRPLVYDVRLQFTLALLFLSLFASIVGFGSFLTLIQRIGADRAAYATVLFPLVALAVSTWLEGYHWTPLAAVGVALVLLGNVLVLMHRRQPAKEHRPHMTLPIRKDILELEDSKIVDVWHRGLGKQGIIMLAVGEGDLPTPKFIADAAHASMLAGETFYTYKRGIPELRQALADYHKKHWGVAIADERIAITSAGMNAMMIAMEIAIGAGDNLVAVSPVWPNIFATAEIMGGEVRMVALTNEGDHWRLDPDRLFAACDGRTRVVYAASPGNPTGWVMPLDQLQAVIEFCRKRGIWFIADEVYNRLIYDRPVAPSALTVARPDDPVLVVNSFSKTWAMTGWRIGWMVMPVGLAPVVERLLEFNTSGGQAFLQRACVAAIDQGESFVTEQIARFRAGRDLVTQRLGGMRRVRVLRSEASFYLMFQVEGEADSHALALRLVDEARVGLAPGAAFGAGGEGFLRLCFAAGTPRLAEAMDRLEPFLS